MVAPLSVGLPAVVVASWLMLSAAAVLSSRTLAVSVTVAPLLVTEALTVSVPSASEEKLTFETLQVLLPFAPASTLAVAVVLPPTLSVITRLTVEPALALVAPFSVTADASVAPAAPARLPSPIGSLMVIESPSGTGLAADMGDVNVPSEAKVAFLS